MVLAYAPSFVFRPALVIIGCALFVSAEGSLTSEAALTVTVIAFLLLVFGQEAVFWGGLDPTLRHAEPHYETRAWMKVAMPLLFIAGFAIVLSETGIVMVGIFEGSEQAGIYAAAQKTSLVVGLILLSMNAIAAPMIASLYAKGRHKELDELVGRVARWSFWPTFAISVVLAIAAKPVLGLFGSEFTSANWMLIVLLSGMLVSAAAGSVGFLMTQTGHQNEAARVYGVVGILHIVMNVIAILLFGTIGAAFATAITLVVWNVWLHRLVVRRLGIHASLVSRWLARA
jgi:O-antigen/teichoic acid export membrane protein